MCWSSSTLFFGVFAKTTDLCMVSRAWKTIKPVLDAVDLIELRRREGTLRFEEGTGEVNAESLPSELWEKIKGVVCDVQVVETVHEFVWQFHLGEASDNEFADEYGYGSKQKLTLRHLLECYLCYGGLMENSGTEQILQDSSKAIDVLLAHLGLSLISQSQISNMTWPMDDPNALLPVSLFSSSNDKRPDSKDAVFESSRLKISCDIKHESSGGSQRFAKLFPSDFTLPSDAHTRFRTLFRLFPFLQQAHAPHEVLPSEAKKPAQTKDVMKEEKEAKEQSADSEPAWHLFTAGYSCD